MTGHAVRWIDLRPREDAIDVDAAIRRVVERGWFVLGPEVESFEAEFATATGSKHTTAVASGTDALTLTLRGLGIGAGDDVKDKFQSPFEDLILSLWKIRPHAP